MDTKEKYLSPKQASELIGVHADTLRKWALAGRVPSVRLKGSNYRRYKLSDIMKMVIDGR